MTRIYRLYAVLALLCFPVVVVRRGVKSVLRVAACSNLLMCFGFRRADASAFRSDTDLNVITDSAANRLTLCIRMMKWQLAGLDSGSDGCLQIIDGGASRTQPTRPSRCVSFHAAVAEPSLA